MIKKHEKRFNKLIKMIAGKNQKALEEFYGIYGKLIYVTALTVSKSYALADEIVDDVLVKIWKNAKKLPRINSPESYLYVLTANTAKDKIKQEKRYVALFDLKEDDLSTETQCEDDFYLKISKLNENEQEIIIMKFVDDLTFERIALEINKPLSTVTSIYYRALEKIKNG